MNDMAKVLIIGGVVLIAAGLIVMAMGKIPGVGKLPGDIFIKRENSSFYFPITTCIILSIVLSILMQIFFRK